jgi:hypothetical protein
MSVKDEIASTRTSSTLFSHVHAEDAVGKYKVHQVRVEIATGFLSSYTERGDGGA